MSEDKEKIIDSLNKEICDLIDNHSTIIASNHCAYSISKDDRFKEDNYFFNKVVGNVLAIPYRFNFILLLPDNTFCHQEVYQSDNSFLMYELTESGLKKLQEIKEKYKDVFDEEDKKVIPNELAKSIAVALNLCPIFVQQKMNEALEESTISISKHPGADFQSNIALILTKKLGF